MKRKIYLVMTVDWEDYDDVCDEIILDDSGIYDSVKDGVTIEILENPYAFCNSDGTCELKMQVCGSMENNDCDYKFKRK